MIGCLQTSVRKQPITALYSEFETVLKSITSAPGLANQHVSNDVIGINSTCEAKS